MALAGDLLSALGQDDRDLADPGVLKELGRKLGAVTGDRAVFEANTRETLGRQVFGAPSHVYRDEILWGQERLELLARALSK